MKWNIAAAWTCSFYCALTGRFMPPRVLPPRGGPPLLGAPPRMPVTSNSRELLLSWSWILQTLNTKAWLYRHCFQPLNETFQKFLSKISSLTVVNYLHNQPQKKGKYITYQLLRYLTFLPAVLADNISFSLQMGFALLKIENVHLQIHLHVRYSSKVIKKCNVYMHLLTCHHATTLIHQD